MKALHWGDVIDFMAFAAGVLLLLSGCAQLPAGSYLEGGAGYSKDSGITGKAVLHIPLDRALRK